MNRAQSRLVGNWILIAAIFGAAVAFEAEIRVHFDLLKWPAIVILLVLSAFLPRNTFAESSKRIESAVQRRPWIKVWLALYGTGIAALVVLVTNTEVRLDQIGSGYLIGAIVGLVGPLFVAIQAEMYRERGSGPNNALERSRGAAD